MPAVRMFPVFRARFLSGAGPPALLLAKISKDARHPLVEPGPKAAADVTPNAGSGPAPSQPSK